MKREEAATKFTGVSLLSQCKCCESRGPKHDIGFIRNIYLANT